MPNNGILFNNYQAKCPKCGGSLEADHIICPYCGADLSIYNEKYERGEEQISYAINQVNDAKKRVRQAEKNLSKNKGKRIGLVLLICFVVFFVIPLIVGLIVTLFETIEENKIEKMKSELLMQEVDSVYMDKLSEEDKTDFTNTRYQFSAGYIEENNNLLKIPFFSQSRNNNAIVKTILYLDKVIVEDIYSNYSDEIDIYTDDFYIYLDAYNGGYYDSTLDTIMWYDSDTKIERLDDYIIDGEIFECYKKDDNTYYLICNPYPEFYFVYEISCFVSAEEAKEIDFDEINFIKGIEFKME